MAKVAELLGGTPHLSPLLRKVRKLGLPSADALLRIAVRRGCTHYTPPDYDESQVLDPGSERLSDAELAVALISGAQEYDPQRVRCAAQMLGSEDVEADEVARLAAMERCEPVLSHIAEAGVRHDSENADFWREVLSFLKPRSSVRPGSLPHYSRFMVQTGTRAALRLHQPPSIWLRPRRTALP